MYKRVKHVRQFSLGMFWGHDCLQVVPRSRQVGSITIPLGKSQALVAFMAKKVAPGIISWNFPKSKMGKQSTSCLQTILDI